LETIYLPYLIAIEDFSLRKIRAERQIYPAVILILFPLAGCIHESRPFLFSLVLALLNKSVDWKQEIFVGMNAMKFKWLYI